jgi:integrase
MENLKIPDKYRRPGLYVYCYRCKRYSNIKTGCLPKVPDCDHPPAKQVYKLKVHIPGTRNMSRTLALDTRDIREVDKKKVEFEEHLKNNNYNPTPSSSPEIAEGDRYLLAYQMKRFIEFITNGGLYKFEAPKERAVSTIKDYRRYFRYFLEGIASAVDVKTIRVDRLHKEHIQLFYDYLEGKDLSDKTYNNIMSYLRAFFNHLITYEELKIKNLFTTAYARKVVYKPQSFSAEEFYRVLSATTPENGFDPNDKRSRYKDWLPTAFKLGAFTGLRLDELVHIKYSDIKFKDGIWLLEADNNKATKLSGRKAHRRYYLLPIIPELSKVLEDECGLEQHRGRNTYIIASKLGRTTVKDIISKGFTHFKRLAGIDDTKCFKDLRTTWDSRHRAEFGDNGLTSIVSDHSNESVVDKHYTAKIEAAKKSINFRVFPKSEDGVN